MKLILPAIAVLALCSAAGAAPLSRSVPNTGSSPASPEAASIGHDLALNQEAIEQSLPNEPDTPLITTSVDTDVILTADELNRDPEFAAVPASEPPPVSTIALGLTFLGASAFIRRSRAERRRARRRTLVRVRAIIAAR